MKPRNIATTTAMLSLLVIGIAFADRAAQDDDERSLLASGTATKAAAESGAQGTVDDHLGLSKESVFDTPDPIVAASSAKDPGENETLAAYFAGAPPMIPHTIDELVPIKLTDNQCLECHDQRDQIGQELADGDPTPAPASHYTDQRHKPGRMTKAMDGARFVCTQCHAPQADALPLVQNTHRP